MVRKVKTWWYVIAMGWEGYGWHLPKFESVDVTAYDEYMYDSV